MKKLVLGFVLLFSFFSQAYAFEVGDEVTICTRGNDRPIGVVLMVTKSRLKVEIIKSGGNFFVSYREGQVEWFELKHIC
jgi:hypothetical protein